MEDLVEEIRMNFGRSNCIASKDNLVDWDGYDELEKKEAVQFFERKKWGVVLSHLRAGNYYYLEEWSVLNVTCLGYYARAYFDYLMETLESEEPDDEFVYFLIGALYQVIYMHKGSPFNEAQTETIENLVHYSLRKENRDRFEYYGNDVKEYGELFFSELRKCRS